MRLSAIVVAFGKEAVLSECLQSLDSALGSVEGETELIVVVNQLSPQSRQALLESIRVSALVDGGRELGFAGGVSAGLARARGEWVALVNDDCIVQPAALAELLAAGSADDDIGSVASRIIFSGTNLINSAGIEVDELGIAYERRLGEEDTQSEKEVVEVFGASAGAGLYRRAMLEDLGGFDDSFFAYLEDADLAWRARMKGWRCVCAPTAIFMHHHSSSFGHGSALKHFLVGRNRVRMLAKNATTAQLRRNAARIVLYDCLYVLFVASTRGTLAPLAGRFRGLREWRTYRRAGGNDRRPTLLAPAQGFSEALRRNRAYRLNASSGTHKKRGRSWLRP